ncbi:hypothetical protein [Mycobacterium sp. 29Ha]|uniref:hypothetical protein n=1 Tax=Mycobacterium sp. 29Ha TaxID=2939268 RepID=UPI002939339B|nr:hypothetical protein [Mycobacterium sp. 29Ha]MDV3133280.1 hypothetical protein [Mycobacterium sp. 29Ha]
MDIETENRTYVESSRDGALMVELDRNGVAVRVQLEPEVNATWTADMLAERVQRLYTLALMRVNRDLLTRMNERGADQTPNDVLPTESEVDAYRDRYIDF